MSRWRNGYRRRFLPRHRRFNSHQHDFTNGMIFLIIIFVLPLLLFTIITHLELSLGWGSEGFVKSYGPIPTLAITLLLT